MSAEKLLSVDDIVSMWEIPYRDVWLCEAKGLFRAIQLQHDASLMSFREFMAWSDGPHEDWSPEDVDAWFRDARVEDYPDWQPRHNPGNAAAG